MGESARSFSVTTPHLSGIRMEARILQPKIACDNLLSLLSEVDSVVGQVEEVIDQGVLEPAMVSSLHGFKVSAEQSLALSSVIRRELAISIAMIEALHAVLPRDAELTGFPWSGMPAAPAPAPPLRRAVRLLRAKDAWRRAVSAWEAAKAVDVSGLSGAEQDAAVDAAREALNALVGTRAPDLATLNEKMAIMVKTDTVLANGYFDDLMADVDALRAGEPASGVED